MSDPYTQECDCPKCDKESHDDQDNYITITWPKLKT